MEHVSVGTAVVGTLTIILGELVRRFIGNVGSLEIQVNNLREELAEIKGFLKGNGADL